MNESVSLTEAGREYTVGHIVTRWGIW